AFSEDEFGAENLEELAALHRHGLGHGEDELEALGRGHEGQRDAGVAGGRLDEHGVLVDAAGLEGLLNHRETDAVLHGRERVEEFELEQNFGLGAMGGGGAVETNQRGVPNGLSDVVEDTGHDSWVG